MERYGDLTCYLAFALLSFRALSIRTKRAYTKWRKHFIELLQRVSSVRQYGQREPTVGHKWSVSGETTFKHELGAESTCNYSFRCSRQTTSGVYTWR